MSNSKGKVAQEEILMEAFISEVGTPLNNFGKIEKMIRKNPWLLNARGKRLFMHPMWAGENAWTPLHAATESNNLEVAHLLLELGADPNAKLNSGWTPLHICRQFDTECEYKDMLDMLITYRAKSDFFSICQAGDLLDVKRALTETPSLLFERGPSEGTPLHFAGTGEVATHLLDAGLDPDLVDESRKMTAMEWITHWKNGRNRDNVAMALASRNAKITFATSCSLGLVAEAERFVRARPDIVNEPLRDKHGLGGEILPLCLAAANGRTQMARFLLGQGARINERSPGSRSAISWAAMFGHSETMDFLIEKKANLLQDHGGPSHYAHFGFPRKHLHIIEALKTRGCEMWGSQCAMDHPLAHFKKSSKRLLGGFLSSVKGK